MSDGADHQALIVMPEMLQFFQANTVGRDFVVGDIHGCFSLLERLLAALDFDASRDRVFCVGDLIDRGPENERVSAFLAADWFASVRGNHEQMCLAALTQGPRQANDQALWRLNGGDWFDRISPAEQTRVETDIAALPYVMEIETSNGERAGIVHADVASGDWMTTREWVARGDDPEALADLVWSRRRVALLSADRRQKAPHSIDVHGIDVVYFGHTPLDRPNASANTRWLDTGAVFGNRLSIAELGSAGEVWSLDAETGALMQGWVRV